MSFELIYNIRMLSLGTYDAFSIDWKGGNMLVTGDLCALHFCHNFCCRMRKKNY